MQDGVMAALRGLPQEERIPLLGVPLGAVPSSISFARGSIESLLVLVSAINLE